MARGRNTALRSLTERKYSRRSPHGSTARYTGEDARQKLGPRDPPLSLVARIMLGVGALVYVQSPAAAPNRRFLLYMCLWAVSNVAVPAAVLGARTSAATVVGLVAPLLSIHGWVFFLTYPANPARERWLERHRAIPRLYRLALALGVVGALAYVLIVWRAPPLRAGRPRYPPPPPLPPPPPAPSGP